MVEATAQPACVYASKSDMAVSQNWGGPFLWGLYDKSSMSQVCCYDLVRVTVCSRGT